ncbi:hypothetical protein A1QO_04185 [Vibrio genomosp. F10 str. ZF-129]|uniref:Transcriptional regulator n=1 Tax=Vibrio genomosp. F10 str. ZF-129 TaxID=1187848 RepID=A0A1E5BIQ3_9VIBR|nr:hypothetical protein [Vibrio genomosp. F10]OEE37311.1 hypothetical protein A1QO_04185 [Vibrio genomosp. F10 str. ZF-129]
MNDTRRKGDTDRLFLVLGAIDKLENPTLISITNALGNIPKGSINPILKKLVAGQVAGVTVIQTGSVYSIESWKDLRESVSSMYETHVKSISD